MKLIFILFLFFTSVASGQTPTFFKTYNVGEGRCVQQTSDDGFIIAGWAVGSSADLLLIKTDSFGDTIWTKLYGVVHWDEGSSIQQTTDGGFVIAGRLGEPDTLGEGYAQVYVMKTDELGDTLWTFTMGDVLGDYGYSVQQTSDSGYIVSGVLNASINGGSPVAFLTKLNSSGDSVWSKIYIGFSAALSVVQIFDGGFMFSGSNGVVRTDFLGDTIWTKKSNWGFPFGAGYSIVQTSDSNFVISGHTGSNFFLCKIDTNGNVIWAKEYDRGCNDNDIGRSLDKCSDGGFIVIGSTYCTEHTFINTDVWLLRTNEYGDTLWTRNLGTPNGDEGYSVKQCSDGGFVLTGSINDNANIFLIKTDSLGNAPPFVSISELPQGQNNIFIYPNPTTGQITLTDLPQEATRVTVYNILGELVYDQPLVEPQINIAELPEGVYSLIVNNNRKIQTIKIIKL